LFQALRNYLTTLLIVDTAVLVCSVLMISIAAFFALVGYNHDMLAYIMVGEKN